MNGMAQQQNVISLDARRAEAEQRRSFDAVLAAAITDLEREQRPHDTTVAPPRLRLVAR